MPKQISVCLLFAFVSVCLSPLRGQELEPSAAAPSKPAAVTARPAPKISSSELARWIDERFAAQWEESGVDAPTVVDDATFMRRVYLDLVGSIPAVPHVRDFFYATGTYKREDLVDRLLQDDRRPERYASRSAEHLARIWRRS